MKKLFTDDKFFMASALLAIVGLLFNDVVLWDGFQQYRITILMEEMCALCSVFLYTSYKKHNKNVMKFLMGALLTLILVRALSVLTGLDADKSHVLVLVMALYSLFALLLFVDHAIINSDRRSSAKYIRANQVICGLILVCELLACALSQPMYDSVLATISNIAGAIGFACVVITVVCVESRLDAYRINREQAGWSEEKGYPEGYVHEYEKK